MARLILAFVLVLSALQAAQAQQYDDPAVALCEYYRFGGNAVPQAYKRVGSKIEGLIVTLSYEYSVLNIKPRIEDISCTFQLGEDGRFEFPQPHAAEALECTDKVEALDGVKKPVPGSPEALALVDELQNCLKVMTGFEAAAREHIKILMTPILAEVYPIRPEDTALTAN